MSATKEEVPQSHLIRIWDCLLGVLKILHNNSVEGISNVGHADFVLEYGDLSWHRFGGRLTFDPHLQVMLRPLLVDVIDDDHALGSSSVVVF